MLFLKNYNVEFILLKYFVFLKNYSKQFEYLFKYNLIFFISGNFKLNASFFLMQKNISEYKFYI